MSLESLEDAVSAFLEYLKEKTKSRYTYIAYKNDLNQFLRFALLRLRKRRTTQITRDDIFEYLRFLEEEQGFNVRTVVRKLNTLNSFFKFLVNKGVIEHLASPMLGVKTPSLENDVPRYLKPVEYLALREVTREDPRLHAMYEVLLQTGIRVGELARLKIEDIKMTERGNPYLHIRAYGAQPERIVPIPKKLYKLLQVYIKKHRPKVQNDEGYIFITRTGRPLAVRNIRDMLKRAMDKVGIKDATINDIRNTYIVYQLRNGVDPLTLARIVGHKRLSSMERYIKLVQEEFKETPKEGVGTKVKTF